MSGNHNQSLHRALAIVERLRRPARMLETADYTADTMTLI